MQEESLTDVSVDEIEPDGVDPATFQVTRVEGMPDPIQLCSIMSSEDSFKAYLNDRFGDEVAESCLEYVIAE